MGKRKQDVARCCKMLQDVAGVLIGVGGRGEEVWEVGRVEGLTCPFLKVKKRTLEYI